MDEWVKKMWHGYTKKYYSVIKKENLTPFAGNWMELEAIMLNEVSQTQKIKYCMFLIGKT